MRSRRNYRPNAREVQAEAERLLTAVLGWKEVGRKCRLDVLIKVILLAAARMASLFAACLQMGQVSDQAVRDALRARLPKRWRRLEDKLQHALREPLPPQTRKRKRTLAIDRHDIPYHGEPQRPNQVVHHKPRAGTTKFFVYATACLVEAGYRYTLAYTWVRSNDTDVAVLKRLLAGVAASGVGIRRLLLDRGFFSVAVMAFLQAQQIPFLMPVVFRGRKPKRGKRHTGLRAFLHQAAGWYRHTQRWRGQEVSFSVCVAYKSFRHRGCRRNKKLVFAAWRIGGTPTEVRHCYRQRFGIETSYRQLGQARIRTSSPDPLLRLFFVGVALLLRNLWVLLRWLLCGTEAEREQRPLAKRCQFKRLLFALAHESETHPEPLAQLLQMQLP